MIAWLLVGSQPIFQPGPEGMSDFSGDCLEYPRRWMQVDKAVRDFVHQAGLVNSSPGSLDSAALPWLMHWQSGLRLLLIGIPYPRCTLQDWSG